MRILRNEARLWAALARWPTGRHDGRLPHAYPYRRGLQPLVVIILGLVAVEAVVVELVLVVAVGDTVWPWLALALHLYALGWLAGFLASLHTRPHVLAEDALLVRDGVYDEVVLPYDAIRDVRQVNRSSVGRTGLKVGADGRATLGHGDTSVELGVGPGRPFHTLAISVDEPAAFVRELGARVDPRPLR
jgi:hypothetical protein